MGGLGLRYLLMSGALLAMSAAKSVITLSVSPPNAYGSSFGAGPVVTNFVTATPSGGIGAYTYLWTKTSGGIIAANSGSSATTAFSGTVALGEAIEAEFKCTVTDSTGSTANVSIPVVLFEVS